MGDFGYTQWQWTPEQKVAWLTNRTPPLDLLSIAGREALPEDAKLLGQTFHGPADVRKSTSGENTDASNDGGGYRYRVGELQISEVAKKRIDQATNAGVCIFSVGPGNMYVIPRELLAHMEWEVVGEEDQEVEVKS